MTRNKMYIFLFTLFLLSGFASKAYCEGNEILQGLKKSYSAIKDIKGRFKQTSRIKDFDKEMVYEGEFFIEIPGKMMWRYIGEDRQEVYVNNRNVIFYREKNKQAIKSRFAPEALVQTPFVLLSGINKIEEGFLFDEKKGYLRLTPRNPSGNLKFADIFPSKKVFPIDKLFIVDMYDNEIEISIGEAVINSGVAPSVFDFVPPPGVEIVEH